jgi:hypothetical protein
MAGRILAGGGKRLFGVLIGVVDDLGNGLRRLRMHVHRVRVTRMRVRSMRQSKQRGHKDREGQQLR